MRGVMGTVSRNSAKARVSAADAAPPDDRTAYTAVGSSRQLRQERGVETREKLISAAIDLMSQEGYASFSTLGVAKAAGVSRGALQYHFDSRESLLVAVRTRLA